ncbi:MAG: alpha-ribazole phosphatase family protein [Gammaproteobacteria bacterium]|nr:alpha-ribazole phosphatase family protein [Gammaproteobacteria bacterium]MBU1647681.1 alpha-ribazole phosphatase family protein [Gammaproteobacteria bacterium]MBU1971827.1 alpha-ribazole phosphatase family protein [Gammaproteobacteria bacterium]
MRLFLIRHPAPDVAPGTCYGRTDLPLAEDAATVVASLAPLLPAATPLFSSPLIRCRRLAELLHPAPHFDDRLRELDFGTWEMQPWDGIDRAALDAWAANPLHFAPPGGEAVEGLRLRVRAFLDELAGDAILVAHAGVMKLCAAELAGVAPDQWFSMRFDYGSASLIEDGRLVWQNRRHHG